MKICFLANASSPHVQRWVKYFVNVPHEVSIITLTPPDDSLEGCQVYELKKGRKFKLLTYWRRIRELKGLLKEINPDIIHAHYIITYGFMAALSGFHPLIISAWGSDILIEAKKSRTMRLRAQRAIKAANLYHCDGIKTKKALEELGASTVNIHTIYFGIDHARASPKTRTDEMKESYGFSGHPVIISLRSLNPIYDIASLMKAVPLVLDEHPEARFVIVGSGSEESMLKELATSLKITDQIRFTGLIPYQYIPRYLASSDIYVSTSLSDAGLAASTGEAMACELPVVITEDPDNRDWVTDGANGYIVPVKSPEKIAEKINILLDDESLRKRFGKLNRSIILERNDYDTEMSKMEKIYLKMAEKAV
jgi:glycosyltransferase involved in cell wall biosynthesis